MVQIVYSQNLTIVRKFHIALMQKVQISIVCKISGGQIIQGKEGISVLIGSNLQKQINFK